MTPDSRLFVAVAMICLMCLTGVPGGPATCLGDEVDAMTRARHDLKLGFTVGGKVLKVHVKPGDKVKAGDVLLELDDKEGVAQIAIWKLRAESTVAVDAAAARLELAKLEEERVRGLVNKQAATPFELTRAEIQTRVETLNVAQAGNDREEAQRQLETYSARHDRSVLRAEIGGTIEQVLVEPGEMVEDLKPVLRLVVTDPLRVDAFVPTGQTLSLKPGDPAWIWPKLIGFEQPIKGVIVHLAQVADASSDTRKVEIEIPNDAGLPAGGQVRVRFTPPTEVAAAENAK